MGCGVPRANMDGRPTKDHSIFTNRKTKMDKEQEIKSSPPIKFPSLPSFLAWASFETWNPPAEEESDPCRNLIGSTDGRYQCRLRQLVPWVPPWTGGNILPRADSPGPSAMACGCRFGEHVTLPTYLLWGSGTVTWQVKQRIWSILSGADEASYPLA